MIINELSQNIEKKIQYGQSPIVVIDGRCASGKTTFGNFLSQKYGGAVIHMDDFFLPFPLRTKDRTQDPGWNIHYERFKKEVIPFILNKKAFSYDIYDCGGGLHTENKIREFDSTIPLYIVEGSYSLHPIFGKYADISVFLSVNQEIQKSRLFNRCGENKDWLESFVNTWIPLEEEYFSFYKIEENCQYIFKNLEYY